MIRPLLPLLLLALCPAAAAQTPEEIVRAFFGPAGIADKKAIYVGEMLRFAEQPTLGETLPENVSITTRSLQSTSSSVVIGVTLHVAEHAQDWYAYLGKSDGSWKLEAVRTLALTGIPGLALAELERKRNRTAEEEWALQNLRLSFRSDAELAEYLKSHARELGKIVELLAGDPEAALRAARELHIGSVERTDSGLVELVIGGTMDNSVGFLWVPRGGTAPAMSPDAYILVEHVVGPWYLFKTT